MATTPPGWYDDGHGAMRWWDGAQWTEHVATPDPEPAEAGTAPTEAEIVAASEAQSESERVAAEVDAAAALGLGLPPVGTTPEYPAAATHPQASYPGDYPGTDAAAGAFTAATEPRKSNLWILWVVLGVLMLGVVIAAAIVIPLIFLSLAGGSSSATAVQPSGADQEAAVAAVELYDDAWQNVDCDAYMASTSEDFRVTTGFEDCASFEDYASNFTASVEDYVVTITEIESIDGTVSVTSIETYDALFDDENQPLDTPQPQEVEYTYTVVDVDGEWVIDALDD